MNFDFDKKKIQGAHWRRSLTAPYLVDDDGWAVCRLPPPACDSAIPLERKAPQKIQQLSQSLEEMISVLTNPTEYNKIEAMVEVESEKYFRNRGVQKNAGSNLPGVFGVPLDLLLRTGSEPIPSIILVCLRSFSHFVQFASFDSPSFRLNLCSSSSPPPSPISPRTSPSHSPQLPISSFHLSGPLLSSNFSPIEKANDSTLIEDFQTLFKHFSTHTHNVPYLESLKIISSSECSPSSHLFLLAFYLSSLPSPFLDEPVQKDLLERCNLKEKRQRVALLLAEMDPSSFCILKHFIHFLKGSFLFTFYFLSRILFHSKLTIPFFLFRYHRRRTHSQHPSLEFFGIFSFLL